MANASANRPMQSTNQQIEQGFCRDVAVMVMKVVIGRASAVQKRRKELDWFKKRCLVGITAQRIFPYPGDGVHVIKIAYKKEFDAHQICHCDQVHYQPYTMPSFLYCSEWYEQEAPTGYQDMFSSTHSSFLTHGQLI